MVQIVISTKVWCDNLWSANWSGSLGNVLLAVTKEEEEEEKEEEDNDDNNEGQFGECAAGTHRFDELALNQIKYCNHFFNWVEYYVEKY